MIENPSPVPPEWQLRNPAETSAVDPTSLGLTDNAFGPTGAPDERSKTVTTPDKAIAATPLEATPSPVVPEAPAPVQKATIEPVAPAAPPETVQLAEEAVAPEASETKSSPEDEIQALISQIELSDAEIQAAVANTRPTEAVTGFDYRALITAEYSARKMRENKFLGLLAQKLKINKLSEGDLQTYKSQAIQSRDLSQNEMNMLVAALAARTNKTSNDFNQDEWDRQRQAFQAESVFPD